MTQQEIDEMGSFKRLNSKWMEESVKLGDKIGDTYQVNNKDYWENNYTEDKSLIDYKVTVRSIKFEIED